MLNLKEKWFSLCCYSAIDSCALELLLSRLAESIFLPFMMARLNLPHWEWDHNDTCCSIMEALHFARLSVIFNFISTCGRKQTRSKHWCVNASSSLVVKTPYRMESQVPHRCLMNVGDFFQSSWDEMSCWCEELLQLNNHISSGINSSKHIYFLSKMMSCAFLTSLVKRNNFPILRFLRCWILSRQMQDDTRGHPRLTSPLLPILSQHILCRKHPALAISYFHHTWPRSISSLVLFPLFASQLSALSMYHPFPYKAQVS